MNRLQMIATGEDQCGAHSSAYYRRQLRECRDLCDEQAILITSLQEKIEQLESQLNAPTTQYEGALLQGRYILSTSDVVVVNVATA